MIIRKKEDMFYVPRGEGYVVEQKKNIDECLDNIEIYIDDLCNIVLTICNRHIKLKRCFDVLSGACAASLLCNIFILFYLFWR